MDLITCPAEDLIIFKALAARDQDWIDGSILISAIYRELAALCELKEAPEIVSRLQALVDKVGADLL